MPRQHHKWKLRCLSILRADWMRVRLDGEQMVRAMRRLIAAGIVDLRIVGGPEHPVEEYRLHNNSRPEGE